MQLQKCLPAAIVKRRAEGLLAAPGYVQQRCFCAVSSPFPNQTQLENVNGAKSPNKHGAEATFVARFLVALRFSFLPDNEL